MELTVPQLAQIVEKSESFVRQHIHRRHLMPRRQGRNVYISIDEARRWALNRNLPFKTPAWILRTGLGPDERVARITILNLREPGRPVRNLFTLIRQRKRDTLGPWLLEEFNTWREEALGLDVYLNSLDTDLNPCQTLINQILNTGVLNCDEIEIEYDIHVNGHRHWAYRDDRPTADTSMRSPFPRFSAEIIEYWNFESDLQSLWLEILNSADVDSWSIGYPLERNLHRVGNVMIARAQDSITGELVVGNDQKIRLCVHSPKLLPDLYRAVVWGSFCGNEVIRQEFAVSSSQVLTESVSEVDHVGFSIFRQRDGQCIDLMETFLIKEVQGIVSLGSNSTIHMRSPNKRFEHRVALPDTKSSFAVHSYETNAGVSEKIRRLHLDSLQFLQDEKNRKDNNFVLFQSGNFTQAVKHLLYIIQSDAHVSGPIYLADPYFEIDLNEKKPEESERIQAYLSVFSATANSQLRILCGKHFPAGTNPWWVSNYPAALTKHVKVKAILRQNANAEIKPGFHDRYLVTPLNEFVITNSINGWGKHGVTFVRMSYSAFRASIEKFWHWDDKSNAGETYVEEVFNGAKQHE